MLSSQVPIIKLEKIRLHTHLTVLFIGDTGRPDRWGLIRIFDQKRGYSNANLC